MLIATEKLLATIPTIFFNKQFQTNNATHPANQIIQKNINHILIIRQSVIFKPVAPGN